MSVSDKLSPLAISGSALTTYNDWLRWKRSLIYYLEAKAITDQARKKAILLHKGGEQLQEIYATLDSDPKAKPPENPFEHALELLDRHFKPSTNRCYERFLFRQIRQGTDSIEQFVVRLRKQAANCKFGAVDEAICDQIIDGTSNADFRRKILEQCLEKLQPIIDLGKLLESVHLQTSSMSGEAGPSQSSDAVAQITNRRFSRDHSDQQASFRRRCFRCGGLSHDGADPSCPAKEATCFRCDKKGHFASRCRTRPAREADASSNSTASEAAQSSSKTAERQKVRTIEKRDDSSSDDGNVFHLQASRSYAEACAASNRVRLRFGDVSIKPVIDSGADVNLLDPRTWEVLQRRHPQLRESDVGCRIFPYGRKAPLQFQTAVWIPVSSKSASVEAKFLVLADDEGDCETIVGRVLATQLGILRVGDEVADVRHLCVAESSKKKLGKLIGVQLKLPLDDSVRPIAQPCRRVPFALRKAIADHISELIVDDVIEPVDGEPTEWVSPIVPVIKKNGDLRLCIDMRLANTAVRREKYPIPTFEELIAEMTDCEIFSRIDLRSAYYQIELDPESRKITTFITPGGIYRFKRLYCGIKCAPEIFQKLMTQLLHGLDNVQVFFDDIIIFSKTKQDHDRHVKAVLDRLTQKGLTVNLEKSTFGVLAINFLGHRLSKNCIKPNESNSDAIKNFKPPENKKDLQSFLGLMNFVSRFIPDYSSLTEPLRKLLPQSVKFVWSPKHSAVFEKLKSAVQNVSLSILDQRARIQIFADASPVGLGAVLLQRRPGSKHPDILGFASRSLSKAEQNYSQIEREALGLVWACERFRMYTLGKPFDLFTDHKPLEMLFAPRSKPNARIERWVLRLQNFDFVVKYVEGHKNIADSFSRLGCTTPNLKSYTETVTSTVYQLSVLAVPKAIPLDEFRSECRKDSETLALKAALLNNSELPLAFARIKYELSVVDDFILRGDRLIPPRSLRERILRQAHEGHPGLESMKRRLRTKVWWPGIDGEAEKAVRQCHSCLAVSRHNPPEPMKRTALPSAPWEYVTIDFLGPLPDGRFILVVVDYFSRFMECVFTRSTSSSVVIQSLTQIFARFGFPARLKSDNASSFTSKEFKEFLEEYGVVHLTSPPSWPQANGEVERQNRSILKRLQIAALEHRDLIIEISKYLLLYHGTPHSMTERTPAELMLNRKIRDKLPSLSPQSVLFEEISDVDAAAKEKGREYADKRRHAEYKNIAVGDKVLIPATKSHKLSPAFDPTPFTVTEKYPDEVVLQRGSQALRRSISAVKPIAVDETQSASPPPSKSTDSSAVIPASPMQSCSAESTGAPSDVNADDGAIRSRSGRLLKPVQRLNL